MNVRVLIGFLLSSAIAATVVAAPPVDLELATEQGVQITAPQQWLQLLASAGIENVRIRGENSGDKPELTNRGSDDRPSYHVVGILTTNGELLLPGGKFHASDRQKLRDYFTRLGAEGNEGVVAPRGRFGLTEKQFTAAHADLAKSVDFSTKDQSLRSVLDRSRGKFALKLSPDAAAETVLRDAEPVKDEIRGLTVGTGLAIVLRNAGLALRPEKALGQPVELRIFKAADGSATSAATSEKQQDSWPVGWDPQKSPGEVAPVLMESLNVEIDGYTLAEAIDAIAPRIKLPIYWDRTAMAAANIDPTTLKVKLPRAKTYYKRVIDRVLAQARLHAELRVDEAGTAFLWITK